MNVLAHVFCTDQERMFATASIQLVVDILRLSSRYLAFALQYHFPVSARSV
jgi:hypothetical protein